MSMNKKMNRRGMLKQVLGVPTAASALGPVGALTMAEERESSGGTPNKNDMPYGNIGDHRISRLILGSNTPGAHSRDLIYVSELGRAYCTKERMLDTYELAESQGITTVLQGNAKLIAEYNKTRGGRLRTIRPIHIREDDNKESIKNILTKAMEDEVAGLFYIMGDRGDYLARANRMDVAGTAMEVAKQLGVTLGLGGHSLQVPIQCEAMGIQPDFYVKTFHHDDYWSATPREYREPYCWYDSKGGNSYSGKTGDHNRFHDNIWCLDAQKTIEVMNKITVPWIAFKVLAAGAISPTSGFKFALQGGADFMAVGMCDFHIKKNVAILKGLFASEIERDRPWRA